MTKYILALDQGTTSSRALLFDDQGRVVDMAQKEFTQYFPQPGWVEHDAMEIWESQLEVTKEVLDRVPKEATVSCMGITNQRETTILWHRDTGKPIHNAIVWQDARSSAYCQDISTDENIALVRSKTGLIINPYFSATKIKYILDTVPDARSLAAEGKLAFGTVDSWLLWNLSEGNVHATDITNASRTMLYNIHEECWDEELLDLFDIPKSILPEVKDCDSHFGDSFLNIPITGMAGDQQAALFGQMCIKPGMAKNTYGTGCFIVVNTGAKAVTSKNNMLTTIAWKVNGGINYAMEGSVFVAGSAIQWLRDGLGIINSAEESEKYASEIDHNDGVYLVPAFVGLGAPHWDADARGTLIGLTRGSTRAHICRAALESIAYQTADVIKAMEDDLGEQINHLKVDGGGTHNKLLMQFQSDILEATVQVPEVQETTALGAAYLAGLGAGIWSSVEDLKSQWSVKDTYTPTMEADTRDTYLSQWNEAVNRSKKWTTN